MACAPCTLGELLRPVTVKKPGNYAVINYSLFCAPQSCSLMTEDGLCLTTAEGATLDPCNTPRVDLYPLATEACDCLFTPEGDLLMAEGQ